MIDRERLAFIMANGTAADVEEVELLKLLAAPVYELEVSSRALNCLRSAGIRDVGTLVGKNEAQLMVIRNMGRKTLDEIKAALAEQGLRLREGK